MVLFPIAPSRVTDPEGSGSVQVSAFLFGAAAQFQLTPPKGWVADLAVGGSALLIRTVGTPTGLNLGATDWTMRLAAHIRLGAGVDLEPWLTLRADVIAGMSPHIVISSTNSTLATWGPAFAAATVALQARW